jgi:Asp-tRNA(Asn)/Glu-tRNA(Gln) amidotransferase A subunit family amidase
VNPVFGATRNPFDSSRSAGGSSGAGPGAGHQWRATADLPGLDGIGLPDIDDGAAGISVPAGFTPDGLPVGLQLVGRRRADWDLLSFARAYEAATGYGKIAPW